MYLFCNKFILLLLQDKYELFVVFVVVVVSTNATSATI